MIVINCLREALKNLPYKLYDCLYGEIDLNKADITQNSGAVYAILLDCENLNIAELRIELIKNGKKISDTENIYVYNYRKYLVLYVGKNIDLLPRIQQHFKTSKGTGGLDLINLNSLKNIKVLFGGVFISEYEKAEKDLMIALKPLVKSDLNGRKPKRKLSN